VAVRPAEGDRLPLDDSYTDIDLQAVESLFGPDFALAIFALPPGSWRGPVKSAFGVHLLNVLAVRPSSPKPFEEVRKMVVSEWHHEQELATREDYIDRLRAKYGVVIDDWARQVLAGAPIRRETP
jgi:parvulin-like peptidyl-prolyl isomerase